MRGAAVMLVLIAACGTATAEDQVAQGRAVYEKWCSACHAPVKGHEMLAGTSTLQEIYKGTKPAALEERTDLTPEIVTTYVRRGMNWMPWFRKTEISDADLAAIGRYLTRNSPKK